MTRHGGNWSDSNGVGVIYRHLFDSPFYSLDFVASSNMKNSQIIRIGIMSTKIWQLSRFITVVFPVEAKPVSHVEI